MSVAIMMRRGLSLRKALASVGSSQGSYYYRSKKGAKRGDTGRVRDPTILSSVKELSLRKPMYGSRMMAALLSRELGRPVNRKLVQHAFRVLGWTTPQMTKNQILRAVSDKIPRPTGINQLWQTDITYILCGVDGWAYLFNVLDAYSREWVSYVFDPLAKKENAIRAVVDALERHPDAAKTVTLYSDNGPQYGSRAFIDSMDALGIRHKFIVYNTPEQDAYVESFHGRFKREYVWPSDFQSFQEADTAIADAFIDYNQRRPHSSRLRQPIRIPVEDRTMITMAQLRTMKQDTSKACLRNGVHISGHNDAYETLMPSASLERMRKEMGLESTITNLFEVDRGVQPLIKTTKKRFGCQE